MSGIYNLYIPICALITLTICAVVFFSKERAKNKETAIFSRVLIYSLIDSILMVIIICLALFHSESVGLMKFLNKVDYAMYILFSSNLFLYVYYVTAKEDKDQKVKLYRFFFDVTTVLDIILMILLLFMNVNVHVDGTAMYSDGAALNSTLIGCAFYFAAMVICLIINFKNAITRKLTPLYVLVLFFILVFVLNQVDKTIVIISMVLADVILIMLFTIENPDMRMAKALEVAREQADNANRSKTDFLSSMSHEIRTPLNAIVGFSNEILEAKDLNEAQTNAKDIVNASDTLLEIVNGILDISKIEAGKLEIVNSTYDAMKTFEELGKLITPKMTEKGLEFNVSISSNLPNTLYGDHANIKKIVTNLLSNACKYTDSGHVNYDVECVNNDETCHLTITVEDSGRGMKEEAMQQLFNKFQRLDEVRNSAIEGTGLGLAITKQLVELMGGKISVNSTYGQGSRFVVELDQKIEFGEIVKKEEVKDTLDLHDISILLVDDTPLNLKVASKLLERYGANKIETCDSGFACIEKIQQGAHYDVILLDDMMPKMSGVETFGKLKALSTFHTPTIVLTANAISGMREKYLAEGFDGYLAKPIEKDQLITVMNEVLSNKVIKSDNQVDNANVEMITINDSKSATNTSQDEAKIEIVDENKKPEENKIEIIDEKKTDSVEALDEKGDENKMDNNENVTQQPVVESVTPTEDTIAKTQMITITSAEPKQPQEGIITITDVQPVQQEETPQVAEAAPAEVTTPEATSTEVPAPQAPGTYDRSYLEGQGVDMNHALELLGDMEMYNDTIKDFASEVEEKWNNIVNYKNENNMPEYAILVHSLKSDCKYLGFMKLADIAYQHELKSKENDSNFVNDHFNELEDEYKNILNIVKNYVEHNK